VRRYSHPIGGRVWSGAVPLRRKFVGIFVLKAYCDAFSHFSYFINSWQSVYAMISLIHTAK